MVEIDLQTESYNEKGQTCKMKRNFFSTNIRKSLCRPNDLWRVVRRMLQVVSERAKRLTPRHIRLTEENQTLP